MSTAGSSMADAATPLSASAKKTSKFKPRTGNATTLASSALASFKTPGFGLKGQTSQAIITISDDSPSTSPRSLKRDSSDLAIVVDVSPHGLKRPKRDGFANKENVVRGVQDLKGKGKSAAMDFDDETCRDRRTPFEEKGFASPARVHSTRVKATVPASVSRSSPNDSGAIPGTPEQLRGWLAHCQALSYPIMVELLALHKSKDPGKDTQTLEAIKGLLDQRIANIEGWLSSPESENAGPRIPVQTTAIDSAPPPPPPTERVPKPVYNASTVIDMTTSAYQIASTSTLVNSRLDEEEEEDLYWQGFDDADISMADPRPSTNDPSTQSSVTLASPPPPPMSRSECLKSPFYDTLSRVLKSTFKLQDFRTNQLEAVVANMDSRDVFVLMPTGGGKSLCYQLPAVCVNQLEKKITFVVTPLLALMEDQVKQLQQRFRVNAIAWNSDATLSERDIASGAYPVIYVTPEKLSSNGHVRNVLQRLNRQGLLARFVIDEAHCISTWGQDFRDAYANLGDLRVNYPGVPIMALTATANQTTIQDIIVQLKLRDPVKLVQSFNRPNLRYTVREKKSKFVDQIASDLLERFRNQSGVIYCRAKVTCENIAGQLKKRGIRATYYHAGLSSEERARAASDWMQGQVSVVVATIAFGMGIDKADVRYVIHHDMPKNMSGYYQETGRAGRDGLPAECILYYNYSDFRNTRQMIERDENTTPESKHRQTLALEEIYAYCRNCSKCRRAEILRHFDEVFDKSSCKKTCDVCSNTTPLQETDSTDIARSIITLMTAAERQSITVAAGQVTAALKGSQAQDNKKFSNLPGFGDAKSDDKDLLDLVIQDLQFSRVLDSKTVQNQANFHTTYLVLGPNAQTFQRKLDREPFIVTWRPKKLTAKLSSRAASGTASASTSTAKPAAKGRKKGKSTEIHEDPIEDDDMYQTDDDGRSLLPAPKRKTRLAASVPSISAGPSISAPAPALARSHSRATVAAAPPTTGTATAPPPPPVDQPTTVVGLHERLQETRKKVMVARKLVNPEDVLDDTSLQFLAVMPPSDYVGFKRVISDVAVDQIGGGPSAREEANALAELKFRLYGQDFLNVCIGYLNAKTNNAPKPAAVTPKPLHLANYGYQPPPPPSVASKPSGSGTASAPILVTTPIPSLVNTPIPMPAPPKSIGGAKKKFQPR